MERIPVMSTPMKGRRDMSKPTNWIIKLKIGQHYFIHTTSEVAWPKALSEAAKKWALDDLPTPRDKGDRIIVYFTRANDVRGEG